MSQISLGNFGIPSWLFLPVIFFLWICALSFVKKVLFAAIRRFVKQTKTRLDDIFIEALDLPLNLLIFTSGAALTESFIPTLTNTQAPLTNYFIVAFKVVTIIAVILFIDKLISELIKDYAPRYEILQSSSIIVHGVIRLIVIALGGLILLDSFGVSITPILASLGIGSLAVALALQPTLENFFSGVQLVIDKAIQVGHFVKLDSGEEGYVHHIGWRSTWVRLPSNNIIILPNKILVNSKITNYHYPTREIGLGFEVGIHYNADLSHVERVTIEVARQVQKEVAGAVKTFEPSVRFGAFESYSIKMTVNMRASEFADQGLIKHELLKRLHVRYREEGIVIPYPVEAVNLTQEAANEEGNKKR